LTDLIAACDDGERAWRACTAGGDDYELLFTAPAPRREAIAALAAPAGVSLHRIGTITADAGTLYVEGADRVRRPALLRGYDHFGEVS
ncbi:MAG TPA: thiamine-phosphate kinase, partial [Rhodocyclaceae bacterium]|nr:thiamine-phosphate kinase [Rhodocyclaceae bacterium]